MEVPQSVTDSLSKIRMFAPNGSEYWMARDLQTPLGYSQWREFHGVIEKARMSCESMGLEPDNHFVATYKMVIVGSDTKRKVGDYYVSRYGAYLVAMNGNPKLPQIAMAQSYFAVQTRRQELSEQYTELEKRAALRDRVKVANKHLSDAAQESGVQKWALFHDAGYRGLYEMGLSDIMAKKGLGPKEQLLDRAGRAELAANEFRITQTEEVLKKDNIAGDQGAREAHHRVAKKVRDTIRELGGTMPEDLPAEPSLKKLIASKRKKAKEIDEKSDIKE